MDGAVGLVTLELLESLAVLRLAGEGEKISILTEERMRALEARLAELAKRKDLRALIIAGNSAGFCGGADISVIQSVRNIQDGERLARDGQRVFQLLDDLPMLTVAAIDGACAGGGCELALACDVRIIASSEASRIGLPEVRLGIIPGFGGTQRLPRLVGLKTAAPIILKGKLLSAAEAKKSGLVHEVVNVPPGGKSSAAVLERAIAIGKQGVLSAPALSAAERFLTFTRFGRGLVRHKLRASIAKESGGHYPAPEKAVQAMMLGLSGSGSQGYDFEARSLGELIVSSECKSLVHVFQASEAAQRLGKAKREEAAAVEAVVVGAGVMGSGIAAVFGSRGYRVTLIDSSSQALSRSKERVEKILSSNRRLSDEKRRELSSNIRFEESLERVASAGLVIEAIFEDFDAKRGLLDEIIKRAQESAIVATNTSSLSVTALASGLARPERIIGMHFFNPAEKMPLVEIIRGEKTGERTQLVVAAITAALGKFPIIVEDGAGFLVNRLLTPYLAEAGELLAEGFSVQQIDEAAKKFGMPMGPFRLLDEVGLDVAVHVSEIMVKAYGESFRGPNFAERMLKAGRKGKKTGSGFYLYQGENETVDSALGSFLSLPKEQKSAADDISDRLILRMANEALRCLHRGAAGRASAEAAQQIDLGTVMGCGFPPFRGGIIHYTESRGTKLVESRLAELAKKYGPRFAPCEEFKAHAGWKG